MFSNNFSPVEQIYGNRKNIFSYIFIYRTIWKLSEGMENSGKSMENSGKSMENGVKVWKIVIKV